MAAIKGYQHPGSPKGTKRGHYNTGTANSHYTHGRCNTAEYRAYTNAKQRCTNPNNSRYSDWGGRGIRFLFCSFKAFFLELGLRPSPLHQLDRINNNGHYAPGNVRWANRSEQAKNKRRNGGAAKRNPVNGQFLSNGEK